MADKQKTTSPLFVRKVFQWWSKKADTEDLLGDIDEYFQYNAANKGKLKAQFIYIKQVLSLSFSYALKKRKRSASFSNYYSKNSISMFKNYFKIALRNFAKQKLFTLINIGGLAMGMSVSLLILAVHTQVVQFDDFQENKDQIHRVVTKVRDQEENKTYATTSQSIYEAFGSDYPGIKNLARINYSFDPTILHQDNEIELSGIYTDPDYFNMFSFDLKSGDKNTALNEPNSIILSPKMAEKFFPDTNPIGLVLHTKQTGDFKITGILKEHPRQTHLKFDAIVSYSSLEERANTSVTDKWQVYWRDYIYLHFDEDKSQADFHSALSDLSAKANEFHDDRTITYDLQAFTKISPGRNLYNDNTPFDWLMTILLFFMGFLILIPACFNYTNLMIARALKRAKEIGIRKVVGSSRNQIAYQFIVEAVILTSIALLGTIFIFTLIRSEFLNMVIGSEMLDLTLTPSMVGWFIVFGLLTGVAAGVFPALYFSKIEPLHSLKSEVSSKSVSISTVRKSLMVVQFVISLVFIIGIGVIVKQHKDMLNYNLGFDKNNVLAVPLRGIDEQLIFNEFNSISGVNNVSLSSNMPGLEVGLNSTTVKQVDNMEDSIGAYQIYIDENFIPSLNFKIKWGENLTKTNQQVNERFLVNEEFMRRNRIINPTGDSLSFEISGQQKGTIVGVVEDFNFMQLNMGIFPLILRYSTEEARYALLKVNGEDIIGTIDQLEKKWESIDQDLKFESYFLDHQIEESYEATMGILKVFGFLGALSITISCIGLLGMVVYFTENRVKEVAVRKIMGASLIDLYKVLGGSFLKLLVIATLIATPLAYFFYDKAFVNMINKYNVGVGWLEISISILLMFVLGGLPILWMVKKISNVNPANNLRME